MVVYLSKNFGQLEQIINYTKYIKDLFFNILIIIINF